MNDLSETDWEAVRQAIFDDLHKEAYAAFCEWEKDQVFFPEADDCADDCSFPFLTNGHLVEP